MASAIGAEQAVIAISKQSIFVLIRGEPHAAAVAAVAAARAAAGDVFFAAKGDAAVSAGSGLHMNFGFVDKHVVLPARFNSRKNRKATP